MAQILLPDADVETSGWTTTPLWSVVDDAYPGGADRIQSSQNPAAVDFEVGLANGTDPGTNKGHRVRYRIRNNATGASVDYLVELKQGTTVIASQTTTETGAADVWYSFLLTETQAGNITDYTDLRIRVSATKNSGGNVRAQVEALQLEIPDVNSCDSALPGGVAQSKFRFWLAARLLEGFNDLDAPSTLQDESGNGNSVRAVNPATYKTGIHSGKPVIEFDGVNDSYRIFWPSAAERITYFVVCKHLSIPDVAGEAFTIASGEASTGKVMLGLSFADITAGVANYVIEQAGTGNHEYYGAGTLDTTAFHLLRVRYDTTEAFFDDGTQRTDTPGDGNAGSLASIGIKLGVREDDTRFYHGQIAEFIVCQGLTDQEELDIEAYLNAAYAAAGVPLLPESNYRRINRISF